QLDRDLHERVLLPRGGLHAACIHSGDLMRTLAAPLMDEAVGLLGQYLPIMDVAQLLGKEVGINTDNPGLPRVTHQELLQGQTKMYLDRAAPLLGGVKHEHQPMSLLAQGSESGKAVGEACLQVMPELKVVRVPGQSDLMFCREQGWLSAHDLHKVLRACREAYEAANTTPLTSPHARFDLIE